MQRRIINLVILLVILLVSLYPLWFFLATIDNNIKINRPVTTSIEKDFNELLSDDYYSNWNYFDAYLNEYNPLISFNKNDEIILDENLIKSEYDYYYIDSFNDLDEFKKILTYNKKEYTINYYGNLNDKFIFFDTNNPITIYYNGSIINHSVILNNTLPSAKNVSLICYQNILIKESIIPQVELKKGMENKKIYLINSLLNIELLNNDFSYKIMNCPYIGITNEDLQYVKYNDYVLNSVI